MSCTFKQYLAESYKLKKIKSLKSTVTKAGVHGVDQPDASAGSGACESTITPNLVECGTYGWSEDEEEFDFDNNNSYNSLAQKNHSMSLADYLSQEEDEEEGVKNNDEKDNDNHDDHHAKKHKKHKKHDHHDDDDKNEDPNKQGLIRKIEGAHLVYKRINEDGTYDELWMYNISRGRRNEYEIRSEILANTDIEQKSGVSASGKQKYILWTNNNVQMMQITGLPN